VIFQQTMPEGTALELLDEVTREMGVDTDPPPGLLVHTHVEDAGRIRVVDVWDSQEAFDGFQESRLMPAMQKVAAGQGMDVSQAPLPETSILPIHGLVKGRWPRGRSRSAHWSTADQSPSSPSRLDLEDDATLWRRGESNP
jgi:hypothetical protein